MRSAVSSVASGGCQALSWARILELGDSYYGYAGHIAWMDWKFLGEKEIIGVVHAQNFPVKWADGVDWAFDDVWEKRKVYVIEGTSKLPQYAYSKRVLFIDKETWGIPYSDIYDRSGELWKIWINDVSFRKSVPGNNAVVYEDEMPFAPAIIMVDMQLEHATKASLPSPRFAAPLCSPHNPYCAPWRSASRSARFGPTTASI